MRKAIFSLIAFAVAAPALAYFGELINSWTLPKKGPSYGFCYGLAWDGEYIWCNVAYYIVEDMIYRCRPSHGSIVSSFESGFNNYIIGSGMCCAKWGGQPCLEVAVHDEYREEYYLYRFNFNGSIVDRIRPRLPMGEGFSGVVFDAKYDWISVPKEAGTIVYKMTAAGTLVSSFVVNKPGLASGITKQGDFFWLSVSGIGVFYGAYKCRGNGSVVASFDTGAPLDCTYENNHLWIAFSSTVRCYDVSNAPAVLPASVGRIKVLFK